MFDRVEITVEAGSGGAGIVSFRREKFVSAGGPDGGDGGDGGDVIVMADASAMDLRRFRQRGAYRAKNGGAGKGKKKHGENGQDLVLKVPIGTVVLSKAPIGGDPLIADLEEVGEKVVVAAGGRGGLGNTHFVSSTNQAPQIAQKGEAGEKNSIILEMRLIADVGIIGYPNAGKSTLITVASAARPKIASYPFTTLEPVLGVAESGGQSFVLAEIPGLIEGAHEGRGLGHDFLKHMMRTKIIIHLIDGSSLSPVEDMIRVNTELALFDSALAQKPQVTVINKIDLPEVEARLGEIREAFAGIGIYPIFISASTGAGVPELMSETVMVLRRVEKEVRYGEKAPGKVFRPQPRSAGVTVRMEGDTFVVEAPSLERIIAGSDISNYEVRRQLDRQLTRRGVEKALERAGIKPGDKVRCGNLEWVWS